MLSRGATLTTATAITLLLFVKVVFFSSWGSDRGGNLLPAGNKAWTFDARKHGQSHTLSPAQCSAAFPRLFDRIDTAVSRYEVDRKVISEDDIHIVQGRCMLQVLIYQGQVYITDTGDHLECYVSNGRERIVATLSLIQRAVASSPEPLPDVEFPITYDDLPTRSSHGIVWGFTRREEEDSVWLLPDYGYWSWWAIGIPSYNSMSRAIKAVDAKMPWHLKVPKAVWRGSPQFAPGIREGLITTAKDKPWADVQTVTIGGDEKHFLSLDQHCQYQYLFQTEGTSYTGRFKFLQLCNSVVVSHKLDYSEFATHLMQPTGPGQNFIEVKRDWSDLDEKMTYYMAHPDEAEAIASRGHEIFAERYLTPSAVSCYIRQMISGWAKIQGFQPSLYTTNAKDERSKQRGIPFEAFVVSFPQDRPGEYGKFAAD